MVYTQHKIQSYHTFTLCSDVDNYVRGRPVEKISLFILYRTNYMLLEPLEASKRCLSCQNYAITREHSGTNKFYTGTNSLKVDQNPTKKTNQ